MRCALCHKQLSFLKFWQPNNFFPLDEKNVLCGHCRKQLIKSLTKKNSNVCEMRKTEISCCVCRQNFITTRKKTGGVWLIKINDFYICEHCLKGDQVNQVQEIQADIA